MTTENTQAKQAAIEALQKINAVEGFDPSALAVEYTDLNSASGSEKRLRLPVMAQIGWFRLKYPEGRIAVSVTAGKDCFVATARVYPHYSAPVDQFLAEATASRGYLPDKPTVSPREWAQTAAVGIALRNAGFGLQFGAAGDSFDSPAVDELGGIMWSGVPELKVACPIAKYNGKTLGEILQIDPKALHWVATKFTGNAEITAAAKLICDEAVKTTA